jgi:hypothetical protein
VLVNFSAALATVVGNFIIAESNFVSAVGNFILQIMLSSPAARFPLDVARDPHAAFA